MKRLLVINPNTSNLFTKASPPSARRSTELQVETVNPNGAARAPSRAPTTSSLSCAPTLETYLQARRRGPVDGVGLACFSDHAAIEALREISDGPVVGFAGCGVRDRVAGRRQLRHRDHLEILGASAAEGRGPARLRRRGASTSGPSICRCSRWSTKTWSKPSSTQQQRSPATWLFWAARGLGRNWPGGRPRRPAARS